MSKPSSTMDIPVIGFAAFSGTGKTTLLESIITRLHADGIRIGLIKQSHHDFDIDVPGKDSHRLRKAGAQQTLITSPYRWALIHEKDDTNTTASEDLQQVLDRLDTRSLDLVLVEGYKHAAIPKIELHRQALDKPLLYPDDANIIAIAHDQTEQDAHTITELDINSPQQIVDFIRTEFL